ncbi:hypothetical protein, partial [Slackia equolifaciens]|uniref:hypothetical protein n=1 Tax=Slackia equolifaciens TaxID=498718 RepID=UPI001C660926
MTFVLQTAAVVQQRRLCDRQQWSRDRQQWSYDRLRRSYDRLRRFCNKGARFGEPLYFLGCCEGKVGAAITHAQSEWQKNQVCHPVSCAWDCGRKVGRDSRVRKGVRMYDRDVVELALLALEEGMTHAEAA